MSNSTYPIGYSFSVVKQFKRRSANEKAAFLLPHLKETDRLLDCGCGPGSITLDFAALLKKGSVCGIDIEPSQVEFAKQLAAERGIKNAQFQSADLFDLPFSDHTFDVVFAHAVLWTLKNPIDALQEIKRVIRPGGLIALREPCADGIIYYPESEVFENAFRLQIRAQNDLGCDCYFGKKLGSLLLQERVQDLQLTVTSDVYSSPEKRDQVVQYFVAAWQEAPWSQHIRKMSWASEGELYSFQKELVAWSKKDGAFISANWCEALGTVS